RPPPRSTLFPYTTLFRSVFGHRLELALLREVELLTRRQLGDRRDTAREVGRGLLRPDAGEVADVIRRLGPTAAHERALARLEAVQADRDVGDGSREHLTLPRDRFGDLRQE